MKGETLKRCRLQNVSAVNSDIQCDLVCVKDIEKCSFHLFKGSLKSKQNHQPAMKCETWKGVDCKMGAQSTVISNVTLFVSALSSKNFGM